MGDQEDLLRVRLRKRKMLKLKAGRESIAKAYTVEEKERMLAEAKKARSPTSFPPSWLALNAGIRDAELKNLTWAQMDLAKGYLTVGKSKTEAGEGRTIPLSHALAAGGILASGIGSDSGNPNPNGMFPVREAASKGSNPAW